MRRSGSSSCMLRPKASLSSEDLQKMAEEPPLTVTMVNTTRLAAYSTERYYMLSELEQNSSSVEFVCDLPSTLSTSDASQQQYQEAPTADAPASAAGKVQPILPSHVILYLLWRPNTYPSPRAFVEGPVLDNIKRIMELGGDDVATLFEAPSPSTSSTAPQYGDGATSTSSTSGSSRNVMVRRTSLGKRASCTVPADTRTKVYVCVDRLSPPPSSSAAASDVVLPSSEISEMDEAEVGGTEGERNVRAVAQASVDGQARRLRQHAVETQIAEGVAKSISTHPLLRGIVEGVSVGTTAEVRAAPGLEVCLKSITHGTGERRRQARALQRRKLRTNTNGNNNRNVDPIRSPIGLVAPHPDDLVGLDPEEEPDAVQGIIQSLTVAEWNGNGDAVCFASRGMESWRKAHGLESETANSSPRDGSAKISRKRAGLASQSLRYNDDTEDIAQTMVVAFMIAVAAFFWTKYRESIWEALFEFLQRFFER